jgi:hypothetical protein
MIETAYASLGEFSMGQPKNASANVEWGVVLRVRRGELTGERRGWMSGAAGKLCSFGKEEGPLGFWVECLMTGRGDQAPTGMVGASLANGSPTTEQQKGRFSD